MSFRCFTIYCFQYNLSQAHVYINIMYLVCLTCPDLSVCLGDRLPVLFSEFMLPWEGVERSESFGGGGLVGSPGNEPDTEPRLFFLLDGGTSAEGRSGGTGSFSKARYTRCMAWGKIFCHKYILTCASYILKTLISFKFQNSILLHWTCQP